MQKYILLSSCCSVPKFLWKKGGKTFCGGGRGDQFVQDGYIMAVNCGGQKPRIHIGEHNTCNPNRANISLSKRLGYGTLAFTSIACYLNSLENDLVHDDVFAIGDNLDIRPETPLQNLFSNDFWGKPMWSNTSHKSYRPLCTLTFRMNYAAHGLNPFGYHAVNVVLHGLVCLLYTFISDVVVFKSFPPAFLAGILFSTHPVHTEAVSMVANFKVFFVFVSWKSSVSPMLLLVTQSSYLLRNRENQSGQPENPHLFLLVYDGFCLPKFSALPCDWTNAYCRC